MTRTHNSRPAAHWFVGDGLVFDRLGSRYHTPTGRPRECSARLMIHNPQRRTARVTARFYHPDRPPTELALEMGGGQIAGVELAELPQVPHNQSFWIEVLSDVPVFPQVRHEDYTFWDPVPDAMVSPTPYPGPLRDERSWVHPDCYQGGAASWFEQEVLTILNPGERPVKARIRYLLRSFDGAGEETIEIPGRRIAQINVWERAPRLIGGKSAPYVQVVGDYAVRIDADGPVISHATRRARWRGFEPVIGSRGSIGVPLRKRHPRIWYYPGGLFRRRPQLPEGEGRQPWARSDIGWNLLFTHNVDEMRPARARLRFHGPDGRHSEAALEVPPMKSDLQWLFHEPWIERHTRAGEPFAMVVESDDPVVPEVTNAEFELWSQVCPGAMSSVNFFPGPLKDQRRWWLGIGRAGAADDGPVEWEQNWHIFNPGRREAKIRLWFAGLENERTLEHRLAVPASAVAMLSSRDIDDLPAGVDFAAFADSDVPVCCQTFAFTFTRGLPYVRGMYGFMGVAV